MRLSLDYSLCRFGTHAPLPLRRKISNILQISEGMYPFTYLGIPLFAGCPKRVYLQPIADKIIAKFGNWIGHSVYSMMI